MSSRTSSEPVAIFPVLLVNFIGMLGYSLIIPLLIFLVQRFGGNAFIYGILGSVYPAFQLIGAPLLGRWSDQIGRRKILLLSQIGTFLAWVLFIISLLLPVTILARVDSTVLGAFSLSIPLLILFLARALDGLTGGNVSVAHAYLADISNDRNRKANFGKLGSSSSLGFVIGPALAGLLGASVYGELLPVSVAALVSLVAIAVIYFYLPESRPDLVDADIANTHWSKLFQVGHKDCYEKKDCPERGLRQILRIKGIPLLFLIYFLNFFGFSFFYSGFPIFAAGPLEWTQFQLGLFLTVSSIIMIIVQGPVLSYLSSRVSDKALVTVGAALISINFFLLPQGTTEAIWTGNVLLSIGNGLMWPSFLSILSRTGPKEIQGSIQGYANSAGSLASIFGLILGGGLFGLLGPGVFYLAAGFMLLIFILSFRLDSDLPQAESMADDLDVVPA